MQAVSIQTAHLKAAACFAADQDVRYYLNGVLVEVRPGETRLVATNGGIAGVLRDVVAQGEQPDLPDVIIPNGVIKLALQTNSTTISLTLDEGKWTIAGISFTPCEGRYPDYRRIIPSRHSGDAAQFSLDLLARIGKAAKALGVRSNPIIRHNGEGGAQVSFYNREDEFVGVIMPLNAFSNKNPDHGLVQWGGDRRPPVRAAVDEDCDLA